MANGYTLPKNNLRYYATTTRNPEYLISGFFGPLQKALGWGIINLGYFFHCDYNDNCVYTAHIAA